MNKNLAAACIMLFSGLTSFHAMAANISASDPKQILEMAKGYGSADLEKDGSGDPLITGRMNGSKYGIYFYNCNNGSSCKDIQFAAAFTKKGISLSEINTWNQNKRFGRAYIDKDGDPRIEMDIPMRHGIEKKTLDDAFDTWTVVIKSFRQHIGFD